MSVAIFVGSIGDGSLRAAGNSDSLSIYGTAHNDRGSYSWLRSPFDNLEFGFAQIAG